MQDLLPRAHRGASAAADARIDSAQIAARLDRAPLTLVHLGFMGMAALGLSIDIMEMALGSVFSAVFSAPGSSVPPARLSWLLSAVYAGAIIGAPVGGWLTDRFGRRLVMLAVLAVLALTSLLAAASPGLDALVLARFLSGLALGAFPPLMISYLSDVLPSSRRGMLILFVAAAGLLGPPAGIFLVRSLQATQPLGFASWRWAFVLGAACAAAACAWAARLPESPRWLAAKGRWRDADQACRRIESARIVVRWALRTGDPKAAPATPARSGAVENAAPAARFLSVCGLFFLSPWALVAFPLLSGAVLIEKKVHLDDALLYIGLSTLGPVIGTVIAALAIDRIERRRALAICALGMLASGAVFIAASRPGWLIGSSLLFALCAAIYIPTINVYASEIFPAARRASAVATAWAFNRVGAAAGPLLLLPVLATGGPAAMFSVIGAAIVASIVLLLALPRVHVRDGRR